MPHIGFDRAASYYDDTRGFADGVAERIRDAILAHTGSSPDTRFLELGVGTGRIALPFIRGGYNFTGVDISQPMMDQLMHKLATREDAPAQRYMLLQADITSLPVADGCYDVAIAVHVLHLVDGWQQALLEARRVLRKPGGWLFIARNEHRDQDDTSAHRMVNRQWETILQDLGVDRASLRPGVTGASGKGPDEAIETYLHVLGAETEQLVLVEHREYARLRTRNGTTSHRSSVFGRLAAARRCT